MRRRDLLVTSLLLLLDPLFGYAQAPQRIWRVGILAPADFNISQHRRLTIPELEKFGFVEGKNLIVHARSAAGDYTRLPPLARELVQLEPDVILAIAPTAIRAARAATSTIPIVMAFGGEDPVAAGLAQSYSRPGGNVTGVVMLSPELDGKRMQIVHEAFPSQPRIAVLNHSTSRNTPNQRAIQAAAEVVGLEVVPFYAAGQEEYEAVFNSIRGAGLEVVAIASAPVFVGDAPRLAELAVKAGLPTVCELAEMAERGCLIGYGADFPELRRRTAMIVARILSGMPAGELPIEQPTAFRLAVNLRTARALGIDLPVSIIARADEVIE